jgi:hypothetical protein
MYIKFFKKKEVQNGNFTKVTYEVQLNDLYFSPYDKDCRSILSIIGQTLNLDNPCGGGNFLRFNVTGISKCSPEDTYDSIKGRDIAENRAIQEGYRKARRVIELLKEYLVACDYTLTDALKYLNRKQNKRNVSVADIVLNK